MNKWLNFWLQIVLLRGRNQFVKRGKICACLTICNLIGQKYDTWSDWQDSTCKPPENSQVLNDVRPNWSKE